MALQKLTETEKNNSLKALKFGLSISMLLLCQKELIFNVLIMICIKIRENIFVFCQSESNLIRCYSDGFLRFRKYHITKVMIELYKSQ